MCTFIVKPLWLCLLTVKAINKYLCKHITPDFEFKSEDKVCVKAHIWVNFKELHDYNT
jgi:hypothetical protein